MRALYLFTEYYPYGDGSMSEHAFLKNEIRYLAEKFDQVVVFPSLLLDPAQDDRFFEIDPSLCNLLRNASKVKILTHALFSRYFYRELLSKPPLFWNICKWRRLVYFTGRAGIVRAWLQNKIKTSDFDRDALFYTFWLTEITLGISSIEYINVISRAHGHDLYEEYHGYMPCQKLIIDNLLKLYLASERAKNYLLYKLPNNALKTKKRYLGVKAASTISRHSQDGKIHVVSCSYLRPLKRVHLIMAGLVTFINKYDKPLFWTHFGDGPEMDRIRSLLDLAADFRLQYDLKGKTPNKEIITYYETKPVDIFILLSETEGGVPIAIQEAQAHGIPVIGTNVGGISEIVNGDVGVLLNKNPSGDEIADAIYYIVSDRSRFQTMRENSIKNWRENFNEAINYEIFADELYRLSTTDKADFR